ncbi:ATP-binding protein [Roseospirillum parvum]|nr:ATP-binding protein [Roseospirillum parvum]
MVGGLVATAAGLFGLGLGGPLGRWQRRRRQRLVGAALDHLFEADGVARAVLDRGGRVVRANAAWRHLFGDLEPALALAAAAERVGDVAAADGAERLARAAGLGRAEAAEVRLPGDLAGAGDAAPRGRASVRPLPAGGRLWTAEDMAARRDIAEVLAAERDDLGDFLYFLPVGLYSADAEGRLRYVNQRLAEWLDDTPEGLTGQPLAEVLEGPERPDPDGEWRGRLTLRPRHPEAAPLPAEVVQGLYDAGGETRTRTVVLRADDAAAPGLRPAVAPPGLAELAGAVPVGLALLDGDGLVIEANPALAPILGLPEGTLPEGPLAELMAEEDRPLLAQALARDSADSLQLRLATPPGGGSRDGATERVVGLFLGPAPRPAGAWLAVLLDATAQKTLEAQFAQAQKIQAMGQLAGGVAHDFNNLLTAMIGFCDLLLNRHRAGDPSFADIMQIKQNANRAANLVRQLLAFSRKQPLRPERLEVGESLGEMSHLLRRLLGERIELKLTHGRDLGAVRVDPGQFDQVIINLAVNARDAMPRGGMLGIATESRRIDKPTPRGVEVIPPGDYVAITVADTGTGIAPENLPRIFEPFFSTKTPDQEGAAQRPGGAGMGLGLATVYGIVRQTGGFVLVESTPGEGTTFTILLPRAEAAAEPPAAPANVPADGPAEAAAPVAETPGGGETVLLVEDEDAVRIFAARALRNRGYQVLEAASGEGALDVLRDAGPIQLMLTDMVMPGMDGATLAGLVRTERPDLKIILMSGYSEEISRGDLAPGPDLTFLPKPFSLKTLAETVREVLDAG